MKLENVYFARRSAASDLRVSASSLRRRSTFATSGCRACTRSNSMKPAAPITRPRSSFTGTRITTNDSSPNCMMSRRMGSPVRTTSRMRLLGITSSTTRPMPACAEASLSRAAYLSLSQMMRASRSTMMAPSQMPSSASNNDFLAILRTAAGSLSRLTSLPFVCRAICAARFDAVASCLFHDRTILSEEELALRIRDLARPGRLRIHFLRPRVGAHRGRPRANRRVPALEAREIVDRLSLPVRNDPGIGSHVGDRVLLARDKIVALEALVEHGVEARGLLHVAL